MNKIALAIHGGAGTILKSEMTPELERSHRSGLENALKAGWEILQKGGSSLDAVEAAVCSLEDFPHFNAGRGSVFTHEGKIELDAAIMDGSRLRAGAVAFVRNIKNPVKLARLVMERTEHVLLAGEGANHFAKELGVELEPDEYFFSEYRRQQLQEAMAAGKIQLDHTNESQIHGFKRTSDSQEGGFTPALKNSAESGGKPPFPTASGRVESVKPKGTVGAVACDVNGHLAAATSTGGMTNKKFGRVGDTPIIGSGTYADDTCAVSCTGHGEFFMLGVTAYDVAARMKYKGLSLGVAAQETIDHLTEIAGEGGFIAVDSKGNVVLPFNSEGMYRGHVTDGGEVRVDIYK
ncbi:MAG TPA: isoaspartyl peptidase/L-asparaginase [Pyrinomonadaceae bacterium]|nr:isoaspartyl peptidase/L-asparaginase [Pyrinomonadaceae bacterium]